MPWTNGQKVAAGIGAAGAAAVLAYLLWPKKAAAKTQVTLTLSDLTVTEGQSLSWSASGLAPSGSYSFNPGFGSSTEGTATSSGTASGSFDIPLSTPEGSYQASITDTSTGVSGTASYTVASVTYTPSVTASPSSIQAGATLSWSVSGFPPDIQVTVATGLTDVSATTDARGSASGQVGTTGLAAGTNQLIASGGGYYAETTFTVIAQVQQSITIAGPTTGTAGEALAYSGLSTGFASGTNLYVYVDNVSQGLTSQVVNGTFTFALNFEPAGTYELYVGTSGRSVVSNTLEVLVTGGPGYTLSFPGSVSPGQSYTWEASGFIAGDSYSLYSGTAEIASGKFDGYGKASGTYTIPSESAGEYEIVIVDTTNPTAYAGAYFMVT